MQEVAYFSTKITSFCNQTFYPDIAKNGFTQTNTCTVYMQENLNTKHIFKNKYKLHNFQKKKIKMFINW